MKNKTDTALIGSFLFLIAVIISLILGFNNKFKEEYNKSIIENENLFTLLQNLSLLLATSIFLYINYTNYIGNKSNDNKLQVLSSILSIISVLIPLYIVIKNYNDLSFNEELL